MTADVRLGRVVFRGVTCGGDREPIRGEHAPWRREQGRKVRKVQAEAGRSTRRREAHKAEGEA